MKLTHDVIIVGAGPGGSTLAALLARKDYSVGIVEKDPFPKFKIGESLLPYSSDILRESGAYDLLDGGKYIRKYGAEFVDHRESETVYFEFAEGLDNDHAYAWQVERKELDHDLFKHAVKCGATAYNPVNVAEVRETKEPVEVVTEQGTLTCRFVVDATGRAAMLGNRMGLRTISNDFNNVAVFTHFKNWKRREGKRGGDIVMGVLPEHSWSWTIPFLDGRTSVGVVCNARNYKEAPNKLEYIRERMSVHPFLVDNMKNAEMLQEPGHAANYSFGCERYLGRNWMMVGDAATFLDPIFSSGVHVSLTSAKLASRALDAALSGKVPDLRETPDGAAYEPTLRKGVQRFKTMLQMFYTTDYVRQMKKTLQRKEICRAFTSAVGGDMWNDENPLFQLGILGKPAE
jgi:flavin-dependent dehydrogenase